MTTLKAAREKWTITYRGTMIQMTADPTLETMEARKKWHTVFRMLKEKNCQPRIQYPVKISFGNEGAVKTVSDEGKLIICL